MTRRVLDRDGHAWPITGATCHICRMPADLSLHGDPHPWCLPWRRMSDDEHDAALNLLADELSAVEHRPLDVWRVSGDPVEDNEVYAAVQDATSYEDLVAVWQRYERDWNPHFTTLAGTRRAEIESQLPTPDPARPQLAAIEDNTCF